MSAVTTDSVPPRERAEFWADLVSRHVTPIRVEPAGDAPLRCAIRAQEIGAIGVAQVSGMGVRAVHGREHVARASDHVYAACVHVEGEARLTHGGNSVTLRPGDVFFTDSREPFTFELDRPWRHLVISLPASWLDARLTKRGSLAGVVLRNHPLSALWASYLAAGYATANDLSPSARALFARQCLELLSDVLEESRPADRSPSDAAREALYATACRVIATRFAEAELTPADVAQAVGVSSRTLARVFAERGETIMRRVFDERVRQAARLLAAPEAAHRSVTEIAFACGFNDLSHFGRTFARHMHMTPSEWRRARS